MLSEEKTYRTRDGSRTGIRVERDQHAHHKNYSVYTWTDGKASWTDTGLQWAGKISSDDLIEEQPAERFFSYDACPVHADGRRRAVTRDGREAVLLCNDGPGKDGPILGWVCQEGHDRIILRWSLQGKYVCHNGNSDLLIPPPPKRVVWVNCYDSQAAADAADREASRWVGRLGGRAYRTEIDL